MRLPALAGNPGLWCSDRRAVSSASVAAFLRLSLIPPCASRSCLCGYRCRWLTGRLLCSTQTGGAACLFELWNRSSVGVECRRSKRWQLKLYDIVRCREGVLGSVCVCTFTLRLGLGFSTQEKERNTMRKQRCFTLTWSFTTSSLLP